MGCLPDLNHQCFVLLCLNQGEIRVTLVQALLSQLIELSNLGHEIRNEESEVATL
jgi:hypothetical protein